MATGLPPSTPIPPRSEGVDAVIRVWRISDGAELATFHVPAAFNTDRWSLFLSPDGDFVGVTTTGPNTEWPIFGAGASPGVTIFRVPQDNEGSPAHQ